MKTKVRVREAKMAKESIITLIHTNDLHSHLENWPKIRRYLNAQQQNLKTANNDVFTFDIGDALDRVNPLTEATLGTANIALLNQAHYDGVTIGNNEGLSLPQTALNKLYDTAKFLVICANIFDKKTGVRPSWATPISYQTAQDGTKIAVIGLTAPFPDSYPLRNWTVTDIWSLLTDLIKTATKQADIIILLSHLGIDTDRQIAKAYPAVDVILGAHTHHLLEHGEVINNTLLAAAGKWGRWIGKINLFIENHKIVKKIARVIITDELPKIAADDVEIAGYFTVGEQQLTASKIAKLKEPLRRNDGTLMQETLNMLKARTNTPAAFLSTGLFLTDLPVGYINKNDLLKLLPHHMYPMVTELDGQNLIRLLKEMHKNQMFMRGFKMVGLGFRGKALGDIVLDGIHYDLKLKQWYYDNELIDEQKRYQIASLDYYKFLPFLPSIEIAGKNRIIMEKILREELADYLMQTYPLN